MEIVVNEWLPEYLRPDADANKTELVDRFVKAWLDKSDRIVIRGNSPFASKFYMYMHQSGGYPAYRKRFEVLFHLFFDSERTVIVDEGELKELPKEIAAKTPDDDRYLIELWYAKQDRIILTTDKRLKDKLKDIVSLKICLLPEFLKEYLV